MTFSYIVLCHLIVLIPSIAVASQNESYEVTASSIPSLSEGIGGYETVIHNKEIENYQEIFLKDSLKYAPSVVLNLNGPVGRQVDFSIRGARSAQNLVLVDGIYANDPASGGGVDLSNFLNADLDRIEVLPGPQTLAYGPGALGGVIQLIPKKGRGNPSLKGVVEGGSFLTKNGAITGQGENGPLQFSTTLAGFSRGPSSFTNAIHGNRQSDRYRNGTFSTRIGYALTDDWEIEGLLRYYDAKVQFDSPKFIPEKTIFLPFEARNFSETDTLLTSLENKWGSEIGEHSLKAMYSRTLRKTTMPTFHNKTIGEHPFLLYRSDIQINSQTTLITGLDVGQERAKEKEFHKRNHGGLYLITLFKPFEATELKGGARMDHYQSLKSRVTFNVGIDQKVTPRTILRTSYGTNFKPPVLSDLFQKNSPWQIPNPFLKPETSQSFEFGVDQTFFEDSLKASLTGFFTRIEKITLSRKVPGGKWQRYNGERRDAKGLEMAFAIKPDENLEFKVALTYTHARDFPHKTKSPLIPSFKGAGEVYWQALSDLSFFMQVYGITKRKDSVTKKRLNPYGTIHVGGSYDINKHAGLFWRIENITNRHYEEIFGYGNRGRAIFIGLEAKT